MYVDLAFSAEAFKRLIRYRMTDQFRPLTTPMGYPQGTSSWLDRLLVFDPVFTQLTEAPVILNEVSAIGSLRPIPNDYSYAATAVAIDVPMTIYYATTQDVAGAGLADPAVGQIPIPAGVIRIILRSLIGEDELPHLQMQLDTTRLSSLPLPPAVIASLSTAATLDTAFDLAGTLGNLFPPYSRRVLNTVITLDSTGNILMRFEFTSRITRSVVTRWQEWQSFVQHLPSARLGGADWCIDVEGAEVAAGMAQIVDPLMEAEPPISFSPGIDWSFGDGKPPKIFVKKAGMIENACAGNDIRFDGFVNIEISVPPEGNRIRGSLSFDMNKNDWDVAKCFGVLLINPLAVFITLFDIGQPGYGVALNALPTSPVIVFGGLILLMIGFDKTIAQNIINEQFAKQPAIQKLPDGNYAMEQDMTLGNPITMNWMLLTEIVGENGRMLMLGALRVPDPILPKLKAEDLVGFSDWQLVSRCEPGRGQSTSASLQLFLRGGYCASSELARPTIPLRYGDRTYDIVGDPLGVYQDPHTEYTQVYFPGIPGTLECKLTSGTLSKPAFADFASNPYPLRLRFYTNGGVREYEFPAPPVYKPYHESLAQAAERISKCKQLMNNKFFSFKWLVDPPPYESVGQRWQIHIRGLHQGRKARVFNQDTGTHLEEFTVSEFQRLDISVVLPPGQHASSLLIALDDMPFINADKMRELSNNPNNTVSNVEVAIRQTNLHPISSDPAADQMTANLLSGKEQRHIAQPNGMFFLPDQDKKQYTLYREGLPLITGAATWEE
ncbi:hypothetical protein [Chitinophaga polysaccharea]|uniref:hypothetical protein n=1 Tax=Chitinophaga polysaccharea TaxID=1293035 RepID=UPI00115925CA|nr:hypothetical protein [Chitinophaga polysaccharea]